MTPEIDTLSATARYCEVALPVPLRNTFTYALPAALNGRSVIGCRVVVPFRNRAMIGVALAEQDRLPDSSSAIRSRIREVVELVDPCPALPPKLIELGHWISRYYLAPIGETFRAMLPPEVEVRHDREYALTPAGRDYLQALASAPELTDSESAERKVLHHFEKDNEDEPVGSAVIHRLSGGKAAASNSSTVVICRRAKWCISASRAPRKSSPGTRKRPTPRIRNPHRAPKKKFASSSPPRAAPCLCLCSLKKRAYPAR